MEVIEKWWFLLLLTAIALSYTIYVFVRHPNRYMTTTEVSNSRPGIILGTLLFAGLLGPQLFYSYFVDVLGKDFLSSLYALYLAALLICSYYFSSATFFLRFFYTLIMVISWPKTEKLPVYLGYFLLLWVPLFHVIKAYHKIGT
jgi:predicted membrane protein